MNTVTVPEVRYNGILMKGAKEYLIGDWTGAKEYLIGDWTGANEIPENLGFEAEGFMIDTEGYPIVYGEDGFERIPDNVEKMASISLYSTGEQELNQRIQKISDVYREGIARITQELYLPSLEISLDKGYTPSELIRNAIHSLDGMDRLATANNASFLPVGNLPMHTHNIPNLANEYYRYLFHVRDGFDIADFRGAALQIHKGMEDKNLAIFTFNKIRHLLPLFLALGGNSPIHEGRYRGNISERTSTKSSWKMVGIPDAIDESFYEQLQVWLNSSIKSVTPYYYAVRYPRVDIRTIENCSMDMVHDVPLLVSLIDINYRLTEKLRTHYQNGLPLPQNIFGDDSGCMVETNIIRENFNRATRFGTKTEFLQLGRSDTRTMDEVLDHILEWIDDVPTIIPGDIREALGYSDNDMTSLVLGNIVSKGNLGEQTLLDLGIDRKLSILGTPTSIPENILRSHCIELSGKFRHQLQKVITNK